MTPVIWHAKSPKSATRPVPVRLSAWRVCECTLSRGWIRPPGWRLPSKDYGHWVDGADPGHGYFRLLNAVCDDLGLPRGTKVPFYKGTPDFKQWAFENKGFRIPNLTGDHGVDKDVIVRTMAERWGWTQAEFKRWLASNNYTPHHYRGSEVQFIDADLHATLRHTGSAAGLRND